VLETRLEKETRLARFARGNGFLLACFARGNGFLWGYKKPASTPTGAKRVFGFETRKRVSGVI